MLLASLSSAAGVATKAPKPTCQNSVLRCVVEVSATASAIAFRMLPRFVAGVYASTSVSMAHMVYRGMGCAYFIPCHTTTARMHIAQDLRRDGAQCWAVCMAGPTPQNMGATGYGLGMAKLCHCHPNRSYLARNFGNSRACPGTRSYP